MRRTINENYRWLIIAACTIAMAVVYGTVVNSFGQFVKPISKEFGYSNTAVSAIISCKSIGVIVGANIVAGVIKKYSAKRCMILFSIMLAISAGAISLCGQIWQFYSCAIVMGISVAGTTLIPISVLVNIWFEDGKRSFALSVAYMGSGLGGFVLNPILNSIIQNNGWNIGFFTIAVLIAVVYIPVIAVMVTPPPQRLSHEGEIHEAGDFGWTFPEAVRSKYFVLSATACCIINITGTAVLYYLVSYYLSVGMTEERASWLAGLCTGVMAFGKVVIGSLVDKVGARNAACIGIGAQIICFIALSFVLNGNLMTVIVIAGYALGIGCITVLPPSIINALFGSRDFTGIMGMMTTLTGIGTAVGPLLMGTMLDITGSYKSCFMILIGLAVIAGICIIVAFELNKRRLEKL